MKLKRCAVMREECDGTGLVFDPDTNRALALNKTGVAVWRGLEKGADAEEIAKGLLGMFKIDSLEQARADVEAFQAVLAAKGLLMA